MQTFIIRFIITSEAPELEFPWYYIFFHNKTCRFNKTLSFKRLRMCVLLHASLKCFRVSSSFGPMFRTLGGGQTKCVLGEGGGGASREWIATPLTLIDDLSCPLAGGQTKFVWEDAAQCPCPTSIKKASCPPTGLISNHYQSVVRVWERGVSHFCRDLGSQPPEAKVLTRDHYTIVTIDF